MSKFYQLAVNFPKIESILTYKSDEHYEVGEMVEVPLGRRKSQGIILKEIQEVELDGFDPLKVKAIESKITASFKLGEAELKLFKWMANYYHYSLGKLIFDCLPKMMKRPKKFDFKIGTGAEFPFELTIEQRNVFEAINNVIGNGFSRHYLHGVTGSGKSLVFLELIKSAIKNGKSAQFLLPEINLTPQFVSLFEDYLGVKVYSYHSAITASEKYTIWKNLKESDEPVLVMGVRSSIFLPIQNLGVVIVDEEHDQSFKQTDRCPYNGRDVAMVKAQINNSLFVMGSATPSVENYHSFSQNLGGRSFYQLEKRVGTGDFAEIITLDSKNLTGEDKDTWPLMSDSIKRIKEKLDKKEQVLVFINKLGFSSFIQCRACAHQFYNEACGCENNLRYFKAKNLLSCSHCDFKMPKPNECPECGSLTIVNRGFGTEKIQETLSQIFKDHKVDRFDRDEIKNMKDLELKLNQFASGEIDILVGTQMLAKGHNFKKVNLVIMLGVDAMLNYADFRASERTYALCEQVAGRAGRYSDESQVVIQTLNPDHEIFETMNTHDMNEFYKGEITLREYCACPPYTKIAMLYFSSRFKDRLVGVISDVSRKLQSVSMDNFKEVSIFGPTPLAVEKKANQFTWALMLKSSDVQQLHRLISTFEHNYKNVSNISVKIDVDPWNTL